MRSAGFRHDPAAPNWLGSNFPEWRWLRTKGAFRQRSGRDLTASNGYSTMLMQPSAMRGRFVYWDVAIEADASDDVERAIDLP
jgi:hypothetical protein